MIVIMIMMVMVMMVMNMMVMVMLILNTSAGEVEDGLKIGGGLEVRRCCWASDSNGAG